MGLFDQAFLHLTSRNSVPYSEPSHVNLDRFRCNATAVHRKSKPVRCLIGKAICEGIWPISGPSKFAVLLACFYEIYHVWNIWQHIKSLRQQLNRLGKRYMNKCLVWTCLFFEKSDERLAIFDRDFRHRRNANPQITCIIRRAGRNSGSSIGARLNNFRSFHRLNHSPEIGIE